MGAGESKPTCVYISPKLCGRKKNEKNLVIGELVYESLKNVTAHQPYLSF
jgi:hypothetical protein